MREKALNTPWSPPMLWYWFLPSIAKLKKILLYRYTLVCFCVGTGQGARRSRSGGRGVAARTHALALAAARISSGIKYSTSPQTNEGR